MMQIPPVRRIRSWALATMPPLRIAHHAPESARPKVPVVVLALSLALAGRAMSRVGAARRRDAHGKNRDDSRGLRAYGGIKKKLSLGSAAVVLASTLVNVFGASSPASATTTELYSWGYNASGQLGNATTTNSTVPVKVSLPSGVTATAAAAGGGHSLAVGSDGKLYAWAIIPTDSWASERPPTR